jgi:lipopolysaccharide transport system permease protein
MFSRATSNGLTSLLDKSAIIEKIYFRREMVIFSSCLSAFIMMGFEFGAFVVFAVALQFIPPLTIILLPLVLIELFVLSLGISLLLSILNVYFRDIKFIWQVLLQAGFFLSPIIYSLDMFPENIKNILLLNPLVHIFNILHDLALNNSLPDINSIMYVVVTTGVIFLIGYTVFRKKEKTIVERF